MQPLIVLAAIPFGIVGAVSGHILLGYDLSLISLMGVIALSGVLVNDSLIMIDYANRGRDTLISVRRHPRRGCSAVSPDLPDHRNHVLLGLCPIIIEDSLQAQYIMPMAISLGFGIVVATAMILVLVPSFYLVLEDAEQILGRANVRA
jgi:multidrug efflux pump subunit AcrB